MSPFSLIEFIFNKDICSLRENDDLVILLQIKEHLLTPPYHPLCFSLCLSQTMQAARCPTDELSLTNCAVVSEKDLQSGQ